MPSLVVAFKRAINELTHTEKLITWGYDEEDNHQHTKMCAASLEGSTVGL